MKKFIMFLAALSMVLGFAVTAAMADVDLYGSVRFRTYWADKSKEIAGIKPGATKAYDDEDLDWRIGYLTRWGVNYKSDKITGKVELDARDVTRKDSAGDVISTGKDGNTGLGDLRVRHIYGEWDFGSGKILIGQTFNPCTVYSSGLGYYSGGIQKFGGLGLKYFRTSQIRLTFGNLQLAFLTPDSSVAVVGHDNTDTDETLPRIEARYSLKLDPFTIDFMGGWQSYEVVDINDSEEDVDSYQLGIYARVNFGPAYVKGVGTWMQNGANYGLWSSTVVEQRAVWENGDIQDNEAFGGSIVAGYKINDMFTVEACAGLASSENDDQVLKNEDDAQVYTLLTKITLAPGFTIQPELIYEDRDEKWVNGVKTEKGDQTVFGVFWVMNLK
jgi:hypothetical protein